MIALVILACALIALLAVYALGLYSASALFLVRHVARRWRPAAAPTLGAEALAGRALTVLIPARNEGRMALRAIQSLLDQDTPAAVHIELVLKDAADTSLPALDAAFPGAHLSGAHRPADLGTAGSDMLLFSATDARFAGPRTVRVAFAGVDGKAEKLNGRMAACTTPLIAVLDADHQAHPGWLRSAVNRLAATGARMVQCRRHPLVADGLFSLWDSLHQHIGCELFNEAFEGLNLGVFFTGTTVVADADLWRAHPLRACITEDIDLSYRLFMEGERLVADTVGASDEEVSPDLYSFLARRRRWANGHTDAFLRHLPRLFKAPLRPRDRLQFLFHGAHYLVATVVFALHLVIGAIFATRLEGPQTALALGLSALCALLVARTQRTQGVRTRAAETAVLTAWFFPAGVMLVNLALAGLLDTPLRTALPLPDWALVVGVFGLLAPLAVLFAGLAAFGQLRFTTAAAVLVSYPLAFYLDLSGVLIGLADHLAGRNVWQAVSRAPSVLTEPTAPVGEPRRNSREQRIVSQPPERFAPVGAALRAMAAEVSPGGLALAGEVGSDAGHDRAGWRGHQAHSVALATGTEADQLGALGGRGAAAASPAAGPAASAGASPAADPVTGLGLTRPVSIAESWGPVHVLKKCMRWLTMSLPRRRAPVRRILWLSAIGLFAGGFWYSRSSRIPLAAAPCHALPHDGDPWVVGPDRIPGYCEAAPMATAEPQWSRRRSDFAVVRDDALSPPDPGYWRTLDSTFFCNLAQFDPGNVSPAPGGGVAMTVKAEARGDRQFTSGSIATHEGDAAAYLYGRYEAELKPAKGSGVISAFFLYRYDPWQEIDIEFLGQDTTQILLNVYFNPGVPGDKYNHGFSGTPVKIDLGFDAAEAFHRYAIEWDVDEIRWFVDDRLIHRRRAGRPTPIPHLPMRMHLNVWPTCAEPLAGPFNGVTDDAPIVATFRKVTVSAAAPDALFKVWRWFDGLTGDAPPAPPAWQDHAEWLQRHRPAD